MIKIIAGLCLIICFSCFGCSWSNADIARHAAFTGLMVVDMAQTLRIADNPDRWHEHNPILGDHPSRSDVCIYFAASYAMVTAAAAALDPPHRAWLQYLVIGVQAASVGNNYAIGLGFGF
jgi:hypothetical protein